MTIRVIALGAGQDVGRSCVVVSLGGRNVMFDCGMHMGYTDERRFPDFTPLSPTRSFTAAIDALLISHFHLDHCGALPYFTEQCGYNGPILMSEPTKALCPILLEDYRKIVVERKGETGFFTSSMIEASMRKVQTINVHQTVRLGPDFEVKAYYAGHVLGAVMFHVRVGAESVVYTGDYNMTPDRHLGAAWIDSCRPDLLITESTYATTTRSSKRARERDFLRTLHDAVAGGGKVLIPVFALGRVQELCLLVDDYWEQMGLGLKGRVVSPQSSSATGGPDAPPVTGPVPVFFSGGMAATATTYYRQYLRWTSEKVIKDYRHSGGSGDGCDGNPFQFKHVQALEGRRQLFDVPGPMVLFSTPGMLHSGSSLEVFRRWCGDPRNVVIIPGYCVAGTVGAKLLVGQRKIDINGIPYTVRMQVRNLSFSAHADAKGILQLIHNCQPRAVMLVHGEAAKMAVLADRIRTEFGGSGGGGGGGGIACYHPANGQVTIVERHPTIPVSLDPRILTEREGELERAAEIVRALQPGVLTQETKESLLLASLQARLSGGGSGGCWSCPASGYFDMQVPTGSSSSPLPFLARIAGAAPSKVDLQITTTLPLVIDDWRHLQVRLIKAVHPDLPVEVKNDEGGKEVILSVRSFNIRLSPDGREEAKVSWSYQDDLLAKHLLGLLKNPQTS